MSQVLLVDLPGSDTEPVNWLVWDREAGRKISGGTLANLGQLSELQGYSRQYPSYGVVPGEMVSCFRVTMPTSGRTAEAALPYQVEELLCTELEEQQIAHEKIVAGKAVDVAVTQREVVQRWYRALQQAELRIRALVPDYLLLPENTVLLEDQRALVNAAGHRAAVDADNLPIWWQLAQRDEPSSVPGVLTTLQETPWLPSGVEQAQRVASRLEALARVLTEPKLSLLQGDLRLRDPLREGVVSLRWPAIAAIVVLLLHWVSLGVQIAVAKREQAVLDAAIAKVYQETFPGTRRVVNPRSQMRSQLLALQHSGADSRLLPWLDKTATALRDNPDVTLGQINFQNQPQVMKLLLQVPSYASIDKISQALVAAGVKVERGTFSQKGDAISGQLIIRESAP